MRELVSMVVRSKMVRVYAPLLVDDVKQSLLLLRYFWILENKFLDVVLIVVVISFEF